MLSWIPNELKGRFVDLLTGADHSGGVDTQDRAGSSWKAHCAYWGASSCFVETACATYEALGGAFCSLDALGSPKSQL
eukprot:5226052-Amphidinium_carterae.1